MTEWIKKENICCLQETHFSLKYTHRLKVKREKKIFHASGNQESRGKLYFITQNTLQAKNGNEIKKVII